MKGRKKDNKGKNTPFYKDSCEHIADELKKLDLLIQYRVAVLRLKTQAMEEAAPFRKMYVSHEEVDLLLSQKDPSVTGHREVQDILKQIGDRQSKINARVDESIKRGVFLSLPTLARLFNLTLFDLQTVIICLAPELERKYDKLYVYLQDDITRKKPSAELVLALLSYTEEERWKARSALSEYGPLFRSGLLQATDDPQSPSGSSGLGRLLKINERILNYLLGNNVQDGRLHDLAVLLRPSTSIEQVLVDPMIKERLLNLTGRHLTGKEAGKKRLVLYLHGPYGVGKRDLALGICEELDCFMFCLDLDLLLARGADFEKLLRIAFREGVLMQAALYIHNADVMPEENGKAKALLKTLEKVSGEYGWLTFIAGKKPWTMRGAFKGSIFQVVGLPIPDVPLRQEAWKKTMKGSVSKSTLGWSEKLAEQFRLTPGQIEDAFESIKNQRVMTCGKKKITIKDFYAACRNQSNQKLVELAAKVEPCYGWKDIVLPKARLAQLDEICQQVKHRYTVFGKWGFDKKLSHGKGLSVLFYGPPGTGKTMAAGVIANALELDLYKIDLSGVVSKYIGETEKNLGKIFHEAETSNAILFFDEADALFGKRTEVSDAHDRYANIETSYLLQKMEEYEGVVILATNIRRNMDDAFIRRIRSIVEFPFPDQESRIRIWKTHFPSKAPLADDIDYKFLSKEFQISGGNIKNIILNSAFLAAEKGEKIGMEHIIHGVKREFEKTGKLWNEKKTCRFVV